MRENAFWGEMYSTKNCSPLREDIIKDESIHIVNM